MEKGSGHSDPLLFSSRKSISQFTHFRIVAFLKGHDKIMERGFFCRLYDLFPAGSRFSYGNIIGNRIMEQLGLLGHIGFRIPQLCRGSLPHIFSGDLHSSPVHIPEPHEKL